MFEFVIPRTGDSTPTPQGTASTAPAPPELALPDGLKSKSRTAGTTTIT
jgi:hypothetical protein